LRHIAVIGAGITGVTTAYALATRGYAVTVIDRHNYAAMETSFANGGQLSASNAEVWNSWTTILKGAKWMLKTDAPLLLNPAPGWHKYSWLAEFIGQIRNYRRNTIETARLAIEARQHLFAIAEHEGIDFDHEQRGILHVYYNRPSFIAAHKVTRLLAEAGLERKPVSPREIREIEPALRGDYYGGFFTPSDSTGDIHKFTRGLAIACKRHGVRFIHGAQVTDFHYGSPGMEISYTQACGELEVTDRLVVDGVVICAGIGSRSLAAKLGDRVNIYPVKGYSITVDLHNAGSRAAAPWVSLLDDQAKIVTSRLGTTRLRVAGTAEFNGANLDIRADRIRPLVEWTARQFPGIDTDRITPWAGLRPMMPGMMPRLGRGRRPGVFYNTGHGHLGWTLSGATAEMVAETIGAELPAEPQLIQAAE